MATPLTDPTSFHCDPHINKAPHLSPLSVWTPWSLRIPFLSHSLSLSPSHSLSLPRYSQRQQRSAWHEKATWEAEVQCLQERYTDSKLWMHNLWVTQITNSKQPQYQRLQVPQWVQGLQQTTLPPRQGKLSLFLPHTWVGEPWDESLQVITWYYPTTDTSSKDQWEPQRKSLSKSWSIPTWLGQQLWPRMVPRPSTWTLQRPTKKLWLWGPPTKWLWAKSEKWISKEQLSKTEQWPRTTTKPKENVLPGLSTLPRARTWPAPILDRRRCQQKTWGIHEESPKKLTPSALKSPIVEEERIKFIKFSPSGSLNLFYMTPEQQMGKPLSILAKINNIETPICLDTSAGANAINTNYLKKLGINPIATKISWTCLSQGIEVWVGLKGIFSLSFAPLWGSKTRSGQCELQEWFFELGLACPLGCDRSCFPQWQFESVEWGFVIK